MRRPWIWLMMVVLLAACGSGDSAGTPTATAGGDSATTAESAATRTPDNAVQTAEADAPNTSFATALPIDGEVRATIKESTFYYSLNVPAGGVVSATLAVERGSPAPAQLQLYDKNQRSVSNAQVAVGDSAGLSYIFAEAGTVFLEIRGNSSIVLNASAAPQNDAGSQQDAPDDSDFSKALLIKDGPVSGILGGADSTDLYAVDIPKGGARWTLDVAMTGSSDITLDTFNREQNYASNAAALATEPISITELIPVQSSGRWFLRVRGNGAYSFTSTISAQNDAGLKADAPDDDDFAKAAKIELGTFQAELGNNDDTDLFSFELPKTGTVLTITLQAASDVTLNTYNSDQNYMDEGNSVAGESVTLTHVVPVGDGGRWYARFRGTGSYSFSIITSP